MPKKISFFKKAWSFIMPVLVQKVNSQYSPDVELFLFHNQLMLTTPQAMYSYGTRYAPFNLAFAELIKRKKLHPQNILLLGGALLSALQILHAKFKMHPSATVVELDGKYQQLVNDYLPSKITDNITYHHANAQNFIKNCQQQFDMIGIDIFIELAVPAFCLQTQFIQQCHDCLSENGIAIMNTHFKIAEEKSNFDAVFANVFTDVITLPHGHNYIYIGTKK